MEIDNIDIIDDDINLSMEKIILYQKFRKLYCQYRMNHLLDKTIKINDDIELPRDSVLHIIDNFDRHESPILNLDFFLIKNSTRRLYLQSISSIIDIDEYKYIYNPNVHKRELMQFYNSEDRITRSLNFKQYITNRNNVMIFNYNPLITVKIRESRLKNYKKFIIIFKTILKNIYDVYKFKSDKIHFLPIFFNNKNINRIRYIKALKKLDHVSIKKTDTYDFFFIIHILKFIKKDTDSLFSDFDYDFLHKLHFVLNIKNDFRIFTLPELENIIAKDGELDTSKFTKFINGLNDFTTAHGMSEEVNEEDDEKDKSPPTPSSHVKVQKEPIRKIIRKSKKQIVNDDINNAILNSKKEDLKKERIDDFKKKSKESLLNVSYNKVTINEALNDKKDNEIYVEKNDLSKIIKNKDITDKSLLKSSIVDFDKTYINNELDRDILKVLHSFNKIGLTLIEINITDKIEEHSKIRNVKVHYKDLDMGKSHKFNFNIPYIEENGMIKFSGVDYKIQKQQVILPIVKIAEDKVNLTSNLNKTIVMRSDYKRNKFKLHIHDFIAELNREKLIEVEFSNEDLSKYKLPLDYAILAGSYKSIKFRNINLDFTNRSGNYADSNLVIFGEMHNKESVAASRKRILDAGFKIIYHEFAHIKDDKDWAKKNNITLKKVDLTNKEVKDLEDKHGTYKMHREREKYMLSVIESIDPNEKAAILLGDDHVMDSDSVVAKSGFDRVDANGIFYKGERSEGSDNIFIGTEGNMKIYFGYDNIIRVYDKNKVTEKYTLREFFRYHFENEKIEFPKIPKEYVEIKLLDKKFPIIFLIAYRLGLTKVLKDLEIEYRTAPVNTRFTLAIDEISIKFRDQYLIFNRYPLRNSLLLAGFEKFKKILTKIYLEDMDDQNTYFKILEEMSIRKNYLKGINDYFDYFVDPITKDILIEMDMPTDFYGLLITATEMLTHTKYKPPASVENFRIRSYELIPAIIYNKLAREFSIQDANRYLERRKFSIPPDAIIYTILQDPTCNVFEDINPFHDLKMENSVTNSGFGGRDAQAMVTRDRVYADDAVGIVSESSPDSGKVGVSYVLSTNPNIKNQRGMFETQDPIKDPINILSPGAILTPGAHQDDSKRIGYISNQLSHQIATENSETSRVRTGFESILPYRVSDSYAIKAKYDGEIIDVDENKQLLKVRYNKVSKANKTLPINRSFKPDDVFYYPIDKKDKSKYNILDIVEYNKSFFTLNDIIDFIEFKESMDIENIPYLFKYIKDKNEENIIILKLNFMEDRYITEVLEYNTVYSIAAGSYIKQSRDAISKEKGFKFKQNEILVYNTDFFQLDPFTQDISWKHGTPANVFIIDRNETYEDSGEISKDFADKLVSSIAHKRIIQMDKNTSIKEIKKIGDMLEIPTPIIRITDANIEAFSEDEDQDGFLTDLNTRALKSKYIGEIVDIEILHTDDQKELHPSIQKLIREKISRKNTSFYKDTTYQQNKNIHSPIPLYSKLYGIDFDNKDTVAIVFTINENVQLGVGDKAILSSQAKFTVGSVLEKSPISETGESVDLIFGASSVNDRIITSWLIQGMSESILIGLENEVVGIYDS